MWFVMLWKNALFSLLNKAVVRFYFSPFLLAEEFWFAQVNVCKKQKCNNLNFLSLKMRFGCFVSKVEGMCKLYVGYVGTHIWVCGSELVYTQVCCYKMPNLQYCLPATWTLTLLCPQDFEDCFLFRIFKKLSTIYLDWGSITSKFAFNKKNNKISLQTHTATTVVYQWRQQANK